MPAPTMPMDHFMTDKVSLIKITGDRRDGIPASVQRNVIYIEDASLVIEPGDQIERVASNGLRELFEVTDPGFNETFGSIQAHYQIRFIRIDTRTQSVPSGRGLAKTTPPDSSDGNERFFPARSEYVPMYGFVPYCRKLRAR
jgi:hypothetical protein